MVEPVTDGIMRNITPKPLENATSSTPSRGASRNQTFDSTRVARGTFDFYATRLGHYSQRLQDSSPDSRSIGGGQDYMYGGDNRGGSIGGGSMSEQGRHGNLRRPSVAQPASSRRQQVSQPTHYGAVPEGIHGVNTPSTSYQGSPHYTSPTGPFAQPPGYIGQYAISPPGAMAIAHTPPPFYQHGYQHPGVDGSMLHAGFQSMIPPQTQVYPYPSPDVASTSYPTPPVFSPPQGTASPSPRPSNDQLAHSATYSGTGPFHSLRYSPMSTPQYSYPPQSFPTSPIYTSQYPHGAYPQQFTSPATESDGQGTWWYVPARQYERPAPYHGHYSMNYASPHPHDAPSSSTQYPISPVMTGGFPTESASPIPPATPRSPKQESVSSHSAPPERPLVRRSYHPNPPSHRSEWVMWVGNVPSDASHDELWRFFNQPLPSKPSDDPGPPGVMSIFLISRSSCAFINFESEAYLHKAIARFHGQPLRSIDPRCPRLVCRVRRKDDDLKAGVGGQRGMGIHTRWVKEQKGKLESNEVSSDVDEGHTTPSSSSDHHSFVPSISFSSDDDTRPNMRPHNSSSSGSFASTNSSVLTKYFPKRYFILKSLTPEDVDISVQKGLWATQKHNEGILDQAFRTSEEVYLIFGVNKSGEWYGYARMTGPVGRGEQTVPWASRADSTTSSRSSLSPVTGRGSVQAETIPEEPSSSPAPRSSADEDVMIFSAHRLVENSPQPVSSSEQARPTLGAAAAVQSAPAELGPQRRGTAKRTPIAKLSLDTRIFKPERSTLSKTQPSSFHLDEGAPYRAMKRRTGTGSDESEEQLGPVIEEEGVHGDEQEVPETPEEETGKVEEKMPREEGWGEPFKVEWIRTDRLPFYRTRHLRNPWNKDREVKISRDGTELEPSVGQQLIDEWQKPPEPRPPGKGASGRRGSSKVPAAASRS
ncbi:YT521-B-like domain-containing protein [Armillaria novae-zelandiae]|uniref:YT521-B-like domain-containing protein n=1 Tax=Armillaria novae-zelandiae TaxID=153914 RepID=A0AA39PQG2_9AGAR|nr:YT521-B-like domain-containing protein [Armillaria novae-zelandiae]